MSVMVVVLLLDPFVSGLMLDSIVGTLGNFKVDSKAIFHEHFSEICFY